MELDIAFGGSWPESEHAIKLAQWASEAAVHVAPELGNARLVVSMLFTGDAEVRVLNREWRGKDKPTNVLSFQSMERDELLELDSEGPPIGLGDIAMAAETMAREAAEKDVLMEHHIAHLIVHGLLHLAGYDHETSAKDADVMESLETAALAKLGIADPY